MGGGQKGPLSCGHQDASESIKSKPGNKYPYVKVKNEVENQFSFFFKKMLNVFKVPK